MILFYRKFSKAANTVRGLRFSQLCSREFRSSGMWGCVTG